MSLLNAVIQEADKVTMDDIKVCRDELLVKIIDFSERLQVFSWGLQNYFLDVYLTSDASRSLEQLNYKKRKYRATIDHDDLKEEIRAFQRKFGDNLDINSAVVELASVVRLYEDMCTVVEGIQTLSEANKEYNSYKYVDAAMQLKVLQENLNELEFEGNMKTALENLLNQTEIQLSLSLAHLSLDWSSMFSWNFRQCVDTLTFSISVQQSDPVLLQKLLKALYVTDQLNGELHGFNQFFVNKLLVKLVTYNCVIFTEDNIGALVLNIKIDLNDTKKPPIATVFNNLTAIFDFLESTIGSNLDASKKFMTFFGDSNRDAFFSIIIENCVRPYLPICDKTYKEYKLIAAELVTFNKFLVELKFVEAHESLLKKYIEYSEDTLFKRKCNRLLADTKAMMNDSLSRGYEFVGTISNAKVTEDSILDVTDKEFIYDYNAPPFFPKCKISGNMKKMSALIMRYLDESTAFPEEYCQKLAHHIKDVGIMYATIVPERYKENLQQNALEIALFFNNCFYLAHTLVGPPWKMTLKRTNADYFNEVVMDLLYDLRMVGMEKISAYLEKTKEMIVHKISSNTLPWTVPAFNEFDRSVNDVVIHLHRLMDNWLDILPRKMYEYSMCCLIETLSDVMMKQFFMDATPISSDVAYLLAMRFQCAINAILRMFKEDIGLETKVKGWSKFVLLPKIFRAHLLEIRALWTESKELTQNFTCEEIRQIIKMRFPDNKYRINVLMDIQ